MFLKMSSAKWRPFCLDLNMFTLVSIKYLLTAQAFLPYCPDIAVIVHIGTFVVECVCRHCQLIFLFRKQKSIEPKWWQRNIIQRENRTGVEDISSTMHQWPWQRLDFREIIWCGTVSSNARSIPSPKYYSGPHSSGKFFCKCGCFTAAVI